MATAIVTSHAPIDYGQPTLPATTHGGEFRRFFADLAMQLRHEMTHSIEAPSSDFFRDHMNALAMCYFAIIVVFLLASLPFLAWAVTY